MTPQDRQLLMRLVIGDLVDEFQAALDAAAVDDPEASGRQPS